MSLLAKLAPSCEASPISPGVTSMTIGSSASMMFSAIDRGSGNLRCRVPLGDDMLATSYVRPSIRGR